MLLTPQIMCKINVTQIQSQVRGEGEFRVYQVNSKVNLEESIVRPATEILEKNNEGAFQPFL